MTAGVILDAYGTATAATAATTTPTTTTTTTTTTTAAPAAAAATTCSIGERRLSYTSWAPGVCPGTAWKIHGGAPLSRGLGFEDEGVLSFRLDHKFTSWQEGSRSGRVLSAADAADSASFKRNIVQFAALPRVFRAKTRFEIDSRNLVDPLLRFSKLRASLW